MCRRSNPRIEKRSHWVRTMTQIGCNLQLRQWRFSWRLYNSWEEAKLPSDVPPNQSQHVTVKPFLFFFFIYIFFRQQVKKCLQQLWQMVVYKYASVLCLRNSTPCRHFIGTPLVRGSCRRLLSFLIWGQTVMQTKSVSDVGPHILIQFYKLLEERNKLQQLLVVFIHKPALNRNSV